MQKLKAAELERKLADAEAMSAAHQAEVDAAKEVATTAGAEVDIAAQELKLTSVVAGQAKAERLLRP